MQYQEFLPSPSLRSYVDHIWINQFSLAQTDIKETIIPDGMMELVFNFGDCYNRGVVGSVTQQLVKGSHVIGIKSKPHFVRANPMMNTIGVRFKPGCFSFFSNIPAEYYKDQCIQASDILGKEFIELEERLENIKNYHSKIELIEQFLQLRIVENNSKEEFISWVKAIYNNPIKNSISHLSNEKHVNYKQLERKFLQYLGITPKLFWKIVRFNNTLKLQSDAKRSSYTQLAYNAGYADQSHLIKEFKEFTNKSPGEYFNDETQLSKVIQNTINKHMSNLYNPLS